MRDPSQFNIGDIVTVGQQIGVEGTTGNSTGIHTHVEMQDYVQNGNTWINNPQDPSLWGTVYLPATDYMGFPNILGISVIYNGTPIPYIEREKHKFKFVLFNRRRRNL